jgi:hypothetical protein
MSRLTVHTKLRVGVAATMALTTLVTAALTAGPAVAAPAPTPQISSGDVNGAWQFPAKNWSKSNVEAGRVDDVLRVGNRVYIAGNFTLTANRSGATQTRTYLAAEDATTGALLAFAPKLNGRAYVLGVSPNHRTLYVGGAFTTVGGNARSHIATFDIATGDLTTAIPDLAINGDVKAISRAGNSMYIGGSFTSAGGHAHERLAKLNLLGTGHWGVGGWNASADGDVRDLIADGPHDRVIVAGWFGHIDGVTGQEHLAAVSTVTARPVSWGFHPSDPVLDIAREGSRLYAGVGGNTNSAMAFNSVSGNRIWYYMADGNIQAVTTVGGWPVFGTHGDYVAPKANEKLWEYSSSTRIKRHKIFELNPAGVLQPWSPDIGSTQSPLGVWALKASQGMLYVGGDFTLVNGVQQARFAMFPQIHG